MDMEETKKNTKKDKNLNVKGTNLSYSSKMIDKAKRSDFFSDL
jgi:hypothetical protein